MADFAAGPEGKPLWLGSILARIGLVWHAQIAAQHIDAGLPVLGPVISQARHGIHPGQPDRGGGPLPTFPQFVGQPVRENRSFKVRSRCWVQAVALELLALPPSACS